MAGINDELVDRVQACLGRFVPFGRCEDAHGGATAVVAIVISYRTNII